MKCRVNIPSVQEDAYFPLGPEDDEYVQAVRGRNRRHREEEYEEDDYEPPRIFKQMFRRFSEDPEEVDIAKEINTRLGVKAEQTERGILVEKRHNREFRDDLTRVVDKHLGRRGYILQSEGDYHYLIVPRRH